MLVLHNDMVQCLRVVNEQRLSTKGTSQLDNTAVFTNGLCQQRVRRIDTGQITTYTRLINAYGTPIHRGYSTRQSGLRIIVSKMKS